MIDRKLGSLDGPVWFENSDGVIVLPPTEADARYWYEGSRDAQGRTYRERGFEFRKCETLGEVDALQSRLVDQERRANETAARRDEERREATWRKVGDRLRERMVSGSTSPYEREFIALYLQLREEKRAKHRQRWLERVSYLWAREFDSSTLPQDRMRG